ncbi:MAG: hypothetical protein ACI9HK_005770, partial [Pirellulaceae bacterium]
MTQQKVARGLKTMSVPKIWDLPFEIRSRVSEHAGRQRAMTADGHLFVVMHRVPEARTTRRHSVYLWRNRKGEWKFSERGAGVEGLSTIVDGYEETVERLEKMQDEANTPDQWYAVVEHAAPVLRAARNLFETLAEARTALESPADRGALQPACDRVSAAARSSELLHQDAKNAIEF